MNIQIKDNFLEKDISDTILKTLSSSDFPYYFQNHQAFIDEDVEDQFFFQHIVMTNEQKINSTYFNNLDNLFLKKLNYKNLFRVKINFNTNQNKTVASAYHIDFKEKHKVAIYYVNTNNGITEFKNGKKISCVQNRLLTFDGDIEHRSISQTDTKYRIVINVNYE